MSGNATRTLVASFVIALVAVLVAFLLNLAREDWRANQPVRSQRIRNPDAGAIDIEISNPSTSTYRAVRATFYVRKREPPSERVGDMIEADKIVFTSDDYLEDRDAYSKPISNLKISDNDEATFRVYIVDPQHANWAFWGDLTIEYGAPEQPKRIELSNHPVLVFNDETSIP